MFEPFINSLRPERKVDTYFGDVEIQKDKETGNYYLEKNIKLDLLSKPVYLTVESLTKEASQLQYDTFVFIEKNLQNLLHLALQKLQNDFGNSEEDLKLKYRIESFEIPVNDNSKYLFELSFLNLEDGFSKCIVEFENLNPIGISFEA